MSILVTGAAGFIGFHLCNKLLDNNIDSQLDYLKEAPYKTPVRRLDETKANRELDVRWTDEI